MNPYPLLAPRIWHGIRLGNYFKLLWKHRFRVSASRWHLAAITVPIAGFNSVMSWLQSLLYESKIRKVELNPAPVFIVGHFRAGTTYLLELLANDPQFTYPTTYESLAPTHFLVTQGWLAPIISMLSPTKRPMDNMAAGMERPQEDEFALIGLGGPTPYARMIFPNDPTPHLGAIRCGTTSPTPTDGLHNMLLRFYRAISFQRPGRLLIKSPVHTGRMAMLAQMFPEAKFIHITRNPRSMMPSLRKAWRILDSTQGLQAPSENLSYATVIADMFDRMYDGFENTIENLPVGSFAELRYEDLVDDPMGQLSRLYGELHLGDFAAVQPTFSTHLVRLQNYRCNALAMEPVTPVSNTANWYSHRYGYE